MSSAIGYFIEFKCQRLVGKGVGNLFDYHKNQKFMQPNLNAILKPTQKKERPLSSSLFDLTIGMI